jgi:hypothetical protein
MLEETTQVVELEEIVNKAFDKIEAKAKKNVKGVALLPQGAKRRVAAAAFHNCLSELPAQPSSSPLTPPKRWQRRAF